VPFAKKICGVYAIETPNGNAYVGSSTNIFGRWCGHRYHLRRGTHHSERLQAAYRKHENALLFRIVEECSSAVLNEREQFHINRLRGIKKSAYGFTWSYADGVISRRPSDD
jgi:predicted GIY-YIG superfamily endonuclease